MVAVDDAGVERRTTGVIGALELSPPGTDILPHEHTTKKAKSDRLDLLRSQPLRTSRPSGACPWPRASPTSSRSTSRPLADVTDEDGVRHTVWRVDDPRPAPPSRRPWPSTRWWWPTATTATRPRSPTRTSARAADGDAGAAGATMAYVVELVEDELTVHAIHRLAGRPARRAPTSSRPSRRGSSRSARPPGMARSPWRWLERGLPHAGAARPRRSCSDPRPDALAEARDLDSSRLDVGLAALPDHDLSFQHGVDHVRAAVASGAAQAGVLLRPATVAQIEATAHGGERMPPKTTFFHPKPRTGLVFRSLD